MDATSSSLNLNPQISFREPLPSDPAAHPFRLVVDPVMRMHLRKALFDLVESHDAELSRYVSEGTLGIESYKEYIELLSRSLKETLGSQEGVAYLMESCGFLVDPEVVNLQPETRWLVTRDDVTNASEYEIPE